VPEEATLRPEERDDDTVRDRIVHKDLKSSTGTLTPPLKNSRRASLTWSETLTLLPAADSFFVMIIPQSAAASRIFALRYPTR
jgi:hypothetical protein